MGRYYYEYATPNQEMDGLNPAQLRKNRSNPDYYTVRQSGTVNAPTTHAASSLASSVVSESNPQYGKHNYGVLMITEFPDDSQMSEIKFTRSEWRERLERETPLEKHTITIDRE